MPWLLILLSILDVALRWLLAREGRPLSPRQARQLNGVIAKCRRLEYEAVRCGCASGGREESQSDEAGAPVGPDRPPLFSAKPDELNDETESEDLPVTKDSVKTLLLSAAQWLTVFGSMTGRPVLVAAAEALTRLANDDAALDAVVAGAATLTAAWAKVLEWLHITHPEAALALSAPTTRTV